MDAILLNLDFKKKTSRKIFFQVPTILSYNFARSIQNLEMYFAILVYFHFGYVCGLGLTSCANLTCLIILNNVQRQLPCFWRGRLVAVKIYCVGLFDSHATNKLHLSKQFYLSWVSFSTVTVVTRTNGMWKCTNRKISCCSLDTNDPKMIYTSF